MGVWLRHRQQRFHQQLQTMSSRRRDTIVTDALLTDIVTLDRPIVSLDLETTGTNAKTDRVVQIGLCKLRPDGHYTEWATLVNPGVPIPKEASDVHKVTDERVRGCSVCGLGSADTDRHVGLGVDAHAFKPWPTFDAIAPMLAKGLEGCDLLGYNLGIFDVPLLQAEFERVPMIAAWRPGRVVDGFRMAQRANPRNLEWFVEKYVGPVDDFTAHDALHDARQSLRGVLGFLQQHPEFPRDVQKLHDMFFVQPSSPGTLDPDGKLAWKTLVPGEPPQACINFGKKHMGKSLREVKALDPGYLRDFILKGEFNAIVQQICRDALAGKFPVKTS